MIPESDFQRWHVWSVEPLGEMADRWSHRADEGHVYQFHLAPIDNQLADLIHPVQRPVVEMLLSAGGGT